MGQLLEVKKQNLKVKGKNKEVIDQLEGSENRTAEVDKTPELDTQPIGNKELVGVGKVKVVPEELRNPHVELPVMTEDIESLVPVFESGIEDIGKHIETGEPSSQKGIIEDKVSPPSAPEDHKETDLPKIPDEMKIGTFGDDIPSPAPSLTREALKLDDFFWDFRDIILGREDSLRKLKERLRDFIYILKNWSSKVPDDKIPLLLKRDSSQKEICRKVFRHYFADVAEFFIKRVKIMIKSGKRKRKHFDPIILRWRALIYNFEFNNVPLNEYSPFLTAPSAEELVAIYDKVESLDDILVEFVQKIHFLLVDSDKSIALKFKEDPTVKNLENLLDTLGDFKYRNFYEHLSLRRLANEFISCYFQGQPKLIDYLNARIEFVSRKNDMKRFKYTKEKRALIDLLLQDPFQVDFTVDEAEFILSDFGKFLISKYEYYKTVPGSDPSELSSLLKRAERVDYLYQKHLVLRHVLNSEKMICPFKADDIPDLMRSFQNITFQRDSARLVKYFIAKFKIMGKEIRPIWCKAFRASTEKKELKAGLQKFALEILARLMKSIPGLEGHYDTLKECAISPTGENLLKLYDIRKALKGEPIKSHAEFHVPYGPSFQSNSKDDFPIVNFTQSFMNFVKASKVTGSWKNPLVIDFFEKFALLLDKESDLKADFILHAYSHFHLLEEQLARPTFPGIHELVDKAMKILGLLPLTSKLYDIYLLSTEVEIALDRLNPSLPAWSIPAAESLDTVFAPIRLLCFTDMTSPNTRIFYRGKVIPESDLTKILTILSKAFGGVHGKITVLLIF